MMKMQTNQIFRVSLMRIPEGGNTVESGWDTEM